MKIGIFGKNARQGASLASLVDEVVGYEEQGFTSYWMQQASTFHALTMMDANAGVDLDFPKPQPYKVLVFCRR